VSCTSSRETNAMSPVAVAQIWAARPARWTHRPAGRAASCRRDLGRGFGL